MPTDASRTASFRAIRLSQPNGRSGSRQLAWWRQARTIARAHRRELVHIPDEQDMRARAYGFEEVIRQQQIEHRGFIYNQKVQIEWIFILMFETIQRGKFQ